MTRKRVLLVEDDPDTRLIYATMLKTNGFEVIQASDGSEGVELAREHVPDLIVMNLVMPQVDGLSATELIRANPATAATPIIVCTAFLHEQGADMAQDAGCDAYLEKPCEPTRLVDTVKRFLDEIETTDPVAAM
jgi:two-component system, cell cycle response regulator DivK